MKISEALAKRRKSLSSDSKSVLTLIGGTTIAQALNFIFSPITTRLFSPEVFGDLSVFTSITGIIGIIICLRYELAIVLPQDDDEGFSLLKLCLIFATIISILAGIIFLFAGNAIYVSFGAPNLVQYWYYVPISLFLTGIIQACNYWLTRTRQFVVLSWNKVIPVIVVNVVSIGLGLLGNRALGARLFAIFLSNIANIAVLAKAVAPEFISKKHATQSDYQQLIKKYKNFLIYDIWGALLNNLSWMIVPILMNAYYGSNAAGQYSIGMRVIQIPASLIGASITQVFLKNAVDEKYKKKLYPYTVNLAKKLFIITLPIALFFLFLGKEVFKVLFGQKWGLAGQYMQILSIWSIVWFISSPISSIYTIVQKQNISLITSTLNLVTRVLSLYLGRLLNSDLIGIMLFAFSGLIVNSLSIYFCLQIAKKSDR